MENLNWVLFVPGSLRVLCEGTYDECKAMWRQTSVRGAVIRTMADYLKRKEERDGRKE